MNMKNKPFSLIAVVLGLPLMVLLINTAPEFAGGEPKLPLLTMLIVSEFGFVVTAIGAFTAVKTILNTGMNQFILAGAIVCAGLSIKFMLIGISYWPL